MTPLDFPGRKDLNALGALFRPRAVAVVGASREPDGIGHRVVVALEENAFPGGIYPVNPKATEIAGRRAFPSLRDVPRPVDLAVVAVPAAKVASIIDEAKDAGVRAAVIISAGFAEAGPSGVALQRELVMKARQYGIRLVGPNCFGVLNTDEKAPLNASFSSSFPPAGNVAMASQSGGLGLALLAHARSSKLGLSQFVSLGNKADVSSNDLLEYWDKDPATNVILLYLESLGNPARFLEIARDVGRRKPIVVLKSGRSSAGTRAAGSHTAALASSDRTVDALLHQAGVLRVETMEQLFHLASGLSRQPVPRGRTVTIITNAGGPGILCTDTCEAAGLEVLEPSPRLKGELAAAVPPDITPANPLDLVASAGPELFAKAIPLCLGAEETSGLIILYTEIGRTYSPAIRDAIGRGIAEGRRGTGAEKPVLLCEMSEEPASGPFLAGSERIPRYRFPEDAARTMAFMANAGESRTKKPGTRKIFPPVTPLKPATGAAPRWLAPQEALGALRAAGFPAVGELARSPDEAVAIAARLASPIALKLASQKITHKTEVGGVQLNLSGAEKVREAWGKIAAGLSRAHPGERLESVLVQPMVTGGVEVFIGMQRDPVFGPVLAFGLGGVFIELLSDVCFRVAPLTDADAREMIREIRGYPLLTGYRGAPPVDIDALEELLLRAASFAEGNPSISSFDFNPVIALPKGKGCLVLDARIEVAPS